jgi:hypothetical protein
MAPTSASFSSTEGGIVRVRISILAAVMAAGSTFLHGQGQTSNTDTGFENHGSITAGYRFDDIHGRRQKFEELFDLNQGFRVFDFNILGHPKEGGNHFADDYMATVSGLGGDPFPGGQLTVRKNKVYDLRVNYRQSYFNWDRNDNAIQPTGLDGLTSNHDWSTVRKFGSVNLGLNATNSLRFNFDYHRTSLDGPTTTTRVLDFFGAPSVWGAFERANPYIIQAPVNNVANRFTGGFSYSIKKWNLFYRLGYQTYEEGLQMDSIQTGQRSINIDDPSTASELLDHASWTEFRQLKSPISEFSYNGRTGKRLELRGGYTFYRSKGPASLNAAFNGIARTNNAGTTFAPYNVSLSDRVQVSEPNNIAFQGFTYHLKSWWNVILDYRYSRLDIDSSGAFHSLSEGSPPSDGVTDIEWRDGVHLLDLNLEFTPARSLIFRPGIEFIKRDVTVFEDGVADPVRSKRSKIVLPIASGYYAPSPKFSVRGDVQSQTNGTPYTRISPRTAVGGRIVVLFRPTSKISVENNTNLLTAKFAATDFKNSVRSNAIRVSYNPNDRWSVFGGFSYDSYFATTTVRFLRGVPPLTAIWRDQTVNRVWQGGIEGGLVRNLGFVISGNYDRTTGAGEISDEPPTFGPLTWPIVTGTAFYDFGRIGRLSVDLQRTYYIEKIVKGNNFSADLLSIRWTKPF